MVIQFIYTVISFMQYIGEKINVVEFSEFNVYFLKKVDLYANLNLEMLVINKSIDNFFYLAQYIPIKEMGTDRVQAKNFKLIIFFIKRKDMYCIQI